MTGFRILRQADREIVDLYGEGARQFGIEQAERYYAGLMATFDLLAAHPRIARERTEFRPPVRLHFYQSHLIVYVIESDGILIVRVLHGRQDWERLLA